MNEKRAWSFAGLFVIALVVSMPFYVADVYAVSVSITKNQGSKGVEGFIDADGDTWTVEAMIAGYDGTIEAKDVKVQVGANEAEFNTCSDSDIGVVCEYVSPLNDGVTERAFDFDVVFNYLDLFMVETSVGDSDTIAADGSGPTITFNRIWQDKGEVKLDFSIKDEPGVCVGLERIEIVDTESEMVLQMISDFGEGTCEFNFNGVLEASLEGEGRKGLMIRAVDRLGHETNKVKSFASDFAAPAIHSEINFIDFGEFIGQYEAATDIEVNVTESGDFLKAKAYSEQTELDGDEVECEFGDEDDLWVCTWRDVDVSPSGSISVRVVAEDEAGNIGEKTLSKSFIVDNSVPRVVFFGTERIFEDVGYAQKGWNRIILKLEEEGAGIDADGIRANLAGLGGESSDAPDFFNETTYEAYWDVKYTGGAKSALIGLSHFRDKVGNEGSRPEREVVVDVGAPKVDDVEIFGWSEAGKKNYFQSGDILSIELEIIEGSGLFILVDLNDAVMDAETKFPEEYNEVGEAGWMAFTEEDCERKEGKGVCVLETEVVKSGPDDSVELEILVMDTAGNEAEWLKEPKNVKSGSRGEYKFKLLGLLTEEEPDYWEVSSVKPLGGENDFVDMDTTELISTRMAMKVSLRTDSNAKVVKIDLIGCEPESGFGANQREVLFDNLAGGATESPKPILILEFSPFDSREYFEVGVADEKWFREAELEYTCYLNIYSKIRRDAIRNAELQEVTVTIPFAFTKLGSKDENLDKKIKDAKDGYYDATKWLGTLAKILDWARYVANIVTIIISVAGMLDILSVIWGEFGEKAEKSPAASAAQAGKAACTGGQVAQEEAWEYAEYVRVPIQILSCVPVEGLGDNWYTYWQRNVLEAYNRITGRSFGQFKIAPAGSLYDNFYIAIIGLCIPGVVYNLKQLREIHCRRIVCLQQEVPQGIATVKACDNLFDLQNCEFFAGPFFSLIPGISTMSMMGDLLKSVFESPVGHIMVAADIITCGLPCWIDGKKPEIIPCKVYRFISKGMDIVESVIGFVKQRPDLVGSPYCDMVKGLKDEGKEVKGVIEEKVPVEET